jgi:hypothetical protein
MYVNKNPTGGNFILSGSSDVSAYNIESDVNKNSTG